jgi:hypothetical protein
MSRYAAKSAVTKYCKIPFTVRLRGIAQKVSAVICLKAVIGAERSKRWLGCPTDRCCTTHISTQRADSRPSLQVRGGSASTARADIHIAEKLSVFLHRRKAASSPEWTQSAANYATLRSIIIQAKLIIVVKPLRHIFERIVSPSVVNVRFGICWQSIRRCGIVGRPET